MSAQAAVRTMSALGNVDDDAEVAAHLVGTIYELAMRMDVCPRTIADNAFCSLSSDENWKKTLEPALREALGRN